MGNKILDLDNSKLKTREEEWVNLILGEEVWHLWEEEWHLWEEEWHHLWEEGWHLTIVVEEDSLVQVSEEVACNNQDLDSSECNQFNQLDKQIQSHLLI